VAIHGPLVLVVGPSGAGKDSIIAGAAARLRDRAEFVFVCRIITRPQDAGGEPHIAASPAEFAERRDAGSFLLHWRAHGLDYGIAATVAADRAAGRTVIANVSRSVVAEARAALTPVRIVQIVAPAPVLAARLARRGRESATDIQLRMTRDAAEAPVGADVTTIANDGALDRAVDTFVALLHNVSGHPPSC
jgi:phosphonate metabolism protein PhnN/1,5-bisphosphokinase (PRPP-forming)